MNQRTEKWEESSLDDVIWLTANELADNNGEIPSVQSSDFKDKTRNLKYLISNLLSTQNKRVVEEARAEMIVDLYEMRVSSMHKYQSKTEKVQDAFHYNFFNVIIAQLFDKYKIPKHEVDEAIRNRAPSPFSTPKKDEK